MSSGVRLASGAALVVAGVAAVGVGFAARGGGEDRHDLASASHGARERVEQALEAQGRVLEPRAAEAARVPELVAGLDNAVDAHTFQDLFETEEWWAATRKATTFSAVLSGTELLASLGPERLEVAKSAVVSVAREKELASGVLKGEGRAYLVAAALVSRARRARKDKPVVLVGELLDEARLKQITDRTGDAVGLTDGRRLLESAGPSELRQILTALAGHENEAPVVRGNGAVAAAFPVVEGLWLWAVFSSPLKGGGSPGPAVLLLWVLGAALGVVGLVLLVRRAAPPPELIASGGTAPTPAPVSNIRAQPTQVMVRSGSAVEAPLASRPTEAQSPDEQRLGARSVSLDVGSAAAVAAAASAPAPRLTPPNEMGRYTLLERIGEGGMAEIYIAAAHGAEGFKRHFVVKRLHPQLARRKEVVSQFIDEARLQAKLVHSNIVPVFDFGRVGEEFFLALEYIHGRDLEKVLQKHLQTYGKPLSIPVIFYVMHEVLEALSYAHTKVDQNGRPLDIVHRDVSPGNVLVSYRGEIKLSDFGIVKAGQRVSRTEVGMVKGNASFMAPEQARGDKVDPRADLFSVGVVMFYCLTGTALYKGETTLNQLMRAAVGPATTQFKQIESLPREAALVLSKALMLDPARRYQNAAEFARDLVPFIGGVKNELAGMMERLFADESRRDFS
jgi:hypothetical protein